MSPIVPLACGHWHRDPEERDGRFYCDFCREFFPVVVDDDDDEPDCDHGHNAANQYHTTNCDWEESAR